MEDAQEDREGGQEAKRKIGMVQEVEGAGGPEEEEGPDMSPEELKETEQEVIRRQIETTEAQLETLERMEDEGDMLDEATIQALKVGTFFSL